MSLSRAAGLLYFNAARYAAVIKPISREGSHWHRDWKPGPYPMTEEERVAAAKKYNMLPEEYEPYPPDGIDDDGLGRGDYPRLASIPFDDRDPYYVYDYPAHRANFGEPFHMNWQAYTFDKPHPEWHKRQLETPWTVFRNLFLFLGGCYLIVFHFPIDSTPPALRKHMAEEDVHFPIYQTPPEIPNKPDAFYHYPRDIIKDLR